MPSDQSSGPIAGPAGTRSFLQIRLLAKAWLSTGRRPICARGRGYRQPGVPVTRTSACLRHVIERKYPAFWAIREASAPNQRIQELEVLAADLCLPAKWSHTTGQRAVRRPIPFHDERGLRRSHLLRGRPWLPAKDPCQELVIIDIKFP